MKLKAIHAESITTILTQQRPLDLSLEQVLGLADIDNAEDKEITYAAFMAGAKVLLRNDNAYLGGKYTFYNHQWSNRQE